jgi:hypothetical protein
MAAARVPDERMPAGRGRSGSMKAIVVYESHWGNTAAVARAIAEGIGSGARAMTTDEAMPDVVAEADLVVAGAPVIAFGLVSEKVRGGMVVDSEKAPSPPDVAHPTMRSWLAALPRGTAPSAAFETRIWWSPRGATGTIERALREAGYETIAKAQKFVVTGTYGPLRDGEIEGARAWGAELARAAGGVQERELVLSR